MKFKLKFMESTTPRIVNAKNSKELSSYIMEKMDKLESLEPMFESVKITPELVQKAWLELIRRARGKFVSTIALDSVCMDYTENTEDWDEPAGTDKYAFNQLYDILVAKLDEGHYELLDEDEYNKKFNIEKGPQTSLDVRMNNIRKFNNGIVRESVEGDEKLLDKIDHARTLAFGIANGEVDELNSAKCADEIVELLNEVEEIIEKSQI